MADLSPLDRAIRAARRGHAAAAQRLLDEVLAAEPDDELALTWRARITDEPDVRAGFLRRALAVNPDNGWAASELAALGDVSEAAAPPPGDLGDVGRRAPTIHHLQCPNCGGQVEVHPDRGTKAAACTHCGSVLDLTGGQLAVIGRFKKRFRPHQDIEPGAEGTFDGERHLVTGWLRYKGWDDEESWTWDEWQLVSDVGAVRYLSYSRDEGFLLQTPLRPTPEVSRRGIELPDGRVPFSEVGPAKITGMAGELTWRPRLDETLQVGEAQRKGTHYSAELTADEVEVVAGRRLSEVEVWTALGRDDKLAELKEREERARARRQSAARLARTCFLAALAFGALAWLAPNWSSTVFEDDVTVEVEPVVLPEVTLERELALYDTVAVGPIRLPSGRALVTEVTATLPVGPPLALDADVAFVGTGGEPIFRAGAPALSGPAGAPATVTSAPVRPRSSALRGGDAFDLVVLVRREWTGGTGEGQPWTEPATVPLSVEVRQVWTAGPFWVGLVVSLLLALTLFVFSRTGPR